jgi:hypothetical protein
MCIGRGFDDEVLQAASDVFRQSGAHEGESLFRVIGGADGDGFGRVVELHEVIAAEGHVAHQIGAEVLFGPLDFPRS